jgi:hypothetical protein
VGRPFDSFHVACALRFINLRGIFIYSSKAFEFLFFFSPFSSVLPHNTTTVLLSPVFRALNSFLITYTKPRHVGESAPL